MPPCVHDFQPSWIVIGSPTNGRTYDPTKFQPGEGLWLDTTRPRQVACEKCAHCGHTRAFDTDVWK